MKTKTFDCVQMKRDIQDAIQRETEHLTPAQEIEHVRSAARRFRESIKSDPNAGTMNLDQIFQSIDRHGRTDRGR